MDGFQKGVFTPPRFSGSCHAVRRIEEKSSTFWWTPTRTPLDRVEGRNHDPSRMIFCMHNFHFIYYSIIIIYSWLYYAVICTPTTATAFVFFHLWAREDGYPQARDIRRKDGSKLGLPRFLAQPGIMSFGWLGLNSSERYIVEDQKTSHLRILRQTYPSSRGKANYLD